MITAIYVTIFVTNITLLNVSNRKINRCHISGEKMISIQSDMTELLPRMQSMITKNIGLTMDNK